MAAPATLIELALDAGAEPPGDALSERILDAALALAAASGIRNLTVDAVARRARVGRVTVYRRFGDRARLVDALTRRETRRCLAELDAAARPEDPIEEQVAAGFATSLRLAREHPLLARLARVEPDTVLGTLNADGGALFAAARAFTAERLRAAQRAGVVGDLDVEASAEILVRLALSFVLLDDTSLPVDDDERLRAIARRTIAPILHA